jgi:hypothetical protein
LSADGPILSVGGVLDFDQVTGRDLAVRDLAVRASGLTERFGDGTVVDDLALGIPRGSVCPPA